MTMCLFLLADNSQLQKCDIPIEPRHYSPGDEFWTYFLASLFRIQALIAVLEFIQLGSVSEEMATLPCLVFRAEYIFCLQYDYLWGRSQASLYAVVGLLLGNQPALDPKGIV